MTTLLKIRELFSTRHHGGRTLYFRERIREEVALARKIRVDAAFGLRTVVYTLQTSYKGLTYRTQHKGVASIVDEPYPPGGTLRVLRNADGRIISGPLVSEITSWLVTPDAAAAPDASS